MDIPYFDSTTTVTWNELVAIANIEQNGNSSSMLKCESKLFKVAIGSIVYLFSNLVPSSLLHHSLLQHIIQLFHIIHFFFYRVDLPL